MTVSPAQLIFSAKLFLAGMIGFALAVRMGLPQPYWALVTCCVCMNPATGAIRSKAAYRFIGTVCAGVITLAMASVFGSAPLLLIAASGIIAATAFGLSFFDRTPRGYGFQLLAITLMLVAVAGVDHPEAMFETVVARVTEISVGILAATFVDGVIAPRSMGGMLRASLQRWLPHMRQWALDVLDEHEADAKAAHDRLKILSDITSLSQLIVALRYDPTISRDDLGHALAIQRRLLLMVPLLSAITARVAALGDDERTALQPWLAKARLCIEEGAAPSDDLSHAVRSLPLDGAGSRPWQQLVHDALAQMLTVMLSLWSEVRQIEASLDGRAPLPPPLVRQVRETRAFPLAADIGHAARMAAGVFVSYALLCGFWYLTGWRQGANAVLLGTVSLAFFGGGDEPGRAIAQFGRFALLSIFLAGLLSYGLLPLANDFPTFVMVMGLFMLPIGAWAAVNPMATLILVYVLSSINLQGHYAPFDFGTFLDASLASILGIFIAFMGAGLFRTWGTRHQLQRFLQIEKSEIIRLSSSATQRSRDIYVERALDRIALMTVRLGATGQVDQSPGLIRRLLAGMSVADLRVISKELAPETKRMIDRVLDQLRMEFATPRPSTQLLARIDAALDTLWPHHGPQGSRSDHVLHALAGLRIALFERAPGWEPKL